ncbi:helix-turn-helix domain-containing protein [Streptosporangium sp. NBC_01756]|uniref:helix-turn-helix domain-containing protein n=1 Tax=Streptosporangium sp. NBC_01756 TaxID=2975950 RepID=UPI002DD9CB05|nr:helix-turn-helix transcriptional regulator [Streptosporangium sp. NBC_01756]WSC89719.1 helix-turn-helix transcriptional regulator [Streptosporangium sp. NBC_01756]
MTVPPEPDSYLSTRIKFGIELRKFRLLSGFTQRRLGAAIHLSVSQLSMLENGHRAPSRELAHRVDDVLGLGTVLVDLLDRLNRTASQLPRWFRPWLEFEREAEALRMWEPLMVPGLLQTEAYAQAVLSPEPGVSAEQVEEHVAARMDRQGILRRSTPPMIWIVLDESVLHRPIADPKVMKGQFEHLLELAESPWISLQVLPYKAYSVIGLLGGFVVADMPRGAPPVAYIDSQSTGDRVSERIEEVRGLAFRYDLIRADALSRRESLDMIKETVQRWTM